MIKTIRRGRPAILHDNRRVQAFVQRFAGAFCELDEEFPGLQDVLVGNTYLQTEGQDSQRPLSRHKLLQVLHGCATISTEAAAVALRRTYSRSTVARYTAHARTASKTIERLLDLHPEWEVSAGVLQAAREELDGPFWLQLQAAEGINLPLRGGTLRQQRRAD